jgi:hypothetical protein
MEVLKVRLGLAIVMGIGIVVVTSHWRQWMPDNSILLTAASLSFAVASSLGAYRLKFLEEKFGVLEIPAIWESELVQAVSWDVVAYASIFSALIIGGALASAATPVLPLSLVPLAYVLSITLIAGLRWITSAVMLRLIT